MVIIVEDSIRKTASISSIHALTRKRISSGISFSSKMSVSSGGVKENSSASFPENFRISSLIGKYTSDKIHRRKFVPYQASRQEKRFSKISSYFFFSIISTKNFAKRKSYFFAFFSSFWVRLIQAPAFFAASLYFSDISALFHHDSGDSAGIKSSKPIYFLKLKT